MGKGNRLPILQPERAAGEPPSCPLMELREQGSLQEGRGEHLVGQWIECCSGRFMQRARAFAGSGDDAKDMLQETWIKILDNIDKYQGAAPACSWVGSILKHHAWKKHRHRAGNEEQLDEEAVEELLQDPDPGPEHAAMLGELRERVLEIVLELPAIYHETFVSCVIEGLPATETAKRLGIPASTVRTRLQRVVVILQKRLGAPREAKSGRTAGG